MKGLVGDGYTFLRSGIGRMMREGGLELDEHGSRMVNDIAYLEPLSRHRNIMSLYNRHPEISPSAYIAPNATVYGYVFVGAGSYFGFGSLAKGDEHAIRVGTNTKIGENTVL
jgi:acetyltransferase-like isoleucine patch superfamily enzyme